MQVLSKVESKKWWLWSGLWSLVLLTVSLVVIAGGVRADTFVQSFNASGTLQTGLIVALAQKNSDTVQAAPAKEPARIYGLVVNPSQAPVTLQNQGQKIFIATSGTYPALVSSQNGIIKVGDYISLSAVDGIGAKAVDQQTYVLGRSEGTFDGKNNVISGSGSSAVGQVNVAINVGKNPMLKDSIIVPTPLRSIGEAIAGKSVSPFRIYSALIIFLVTAIIAASLLWVGVRGGMVAIGRNPLSRHSIAQSLTQVVIVALLVFIAGLFGVYLLLRL